MTDNNDFRASFISTVRPLIFNFNIEFMFLYTDGTEIDQYNV